MAGRMSKGYAIASKPYDNGSWYFSTVSPYKGRGWVNDSRDAVLFLSGGIAESYARSLGLKPKEFEVVSIYQEIPDAT